MAPTTPKGYWIGRVDVEDADEYRRYVEANGPVFAAHHARFLVRGGRFETKEGGARARNVVLEFPSYEAAMACYESPEYQEVLKLRLREGASVSDMIVIEGYDDPTPA